MSLEKNDFVYILMLLMYKIMGICFFSYYTRIILCIISIIDKIINKTRISSVKVSSREGTSSEMVEIPN